MIATYIVGSLIGVLVVLALRSIFKRYKKGELGCGCSGCSGCTGCFAGSRSPESCKKYINEENSDR